jgi:hypothetical protein
MDYTYISFLMTSKFSLKKASRRSLVSFLSHQVGMHCDRCSHGQRAGFCLMRVAGRGYRNSLGQLRLLGMRKGGTKRFLAGGGRLSGGVVRGAKNWNFAKILDILGGLRYFPLFGCPSEGGPGEKMKILEVICGKRAGT